MCSPLLLGTQSHPHPLLWLLVSSSAAATVILAETLPLLYQGLYYLGYNMRGFTCSKEPKVPTDAFGG